MSTPADPERAELALHVDASRQRYEAAVARLLARVQELESRLRSQQTRCNDLHEDRFCLDRCRVHLRALAQDVLRLRPAMVAMQDSCDTIQVTFLHFTDLAARLGEVAPAPTVSLDVSDAIGM